MSMGNEGVGLGSMDLADTRHRGRMPDCSQLCHHPAG